MAIYLVSSLGDGTDNGTANTLNPTATDWGKAEPTLYGAFALATVDGDTILVDVDHTETVATSGSVTASIRIVVVDKDASNALASMAETLGNILSSNTTVTLMAVTAGKKIHVHGLTIKLTGGSQRSFVWFSGTDIEFTLQDCTGWNASTGDSSVTLWSSIDSRAFSEAYNYTDRRDNDKAWGGNGRIRFYGGKLSASGFAVTTCNSPSGTDPGGTTWEFYGFDFSAASATANMLGASSTFSPTARYVGCKLPASYVPMAAQTGASQANAEAWFHDCIAGSARGIFGYANGMGSVVSDTGVYVTAGVAAKSWRITTLTGVTKNNPFRTPWIDFYNAVNTSISPYLDVLRNNDSTTAWTDGEVWSETLYKGTTSSDLLSRTDDKVTELGTAASQATSALAAGDWTGETGSCWFGKLGGVALTAAEDGHLSMRVCVGVVITGKLYVDPQIRT